MSAASAPAKRTTVLAAERKEPVLEFAAGRRLSYGSRMAWTAGLVAAGFAVQVAFLNPWTGVPFLLAALVLAWVRGFDNRLDRRGYSADAAWERAPFEKVKEALTLDRFMRTWDASGLDITSGGGFVLWLLVLVAVVAAAALAAGEIGEAAGWIVGVDGAVLLLAQWFSGMRTIDRRPDLILKARTLVDVADAAEEEIRAVGTLSAQMRMEGEGEDRAPVDVRLGITNPDAGPDFLGVQGQVVLNRVQGTPYPYFYAVVVVRPGKGLLAAAKNANPPHGVIIEAKREADVEIAVVRQLTSKTSGYHTDAGQALRVLSVALTLARGWLGRSRLTHA